MPKKGKKEPKEYDIRDDVPVLAQNLCGIQSAAKVQLTLSKSEAALYLWTHTIANDKQRLEIAKLGALTWMVHLSLNTSDQQARYEGTHITTL